MSKQTSIVGPKYTILKISLLLTALELIRHKTCWAHRLISKTMFLKEEEICYKMVYNTFLLGHSPVSKFQR